MVKTLLKTRVLKRLLTSQEGKIGYIVAWMLGIPVPVLLAIYFLRGCD